MAKRLNVLVLLFLLLIITACGSNEEKKLKTPEKEIIVSAAASLTDALNEIQRVFHEKHPNIKVTYNFGGSGKLVNQIQSGAPADIFLSASETDMNKLEEEGLIDPSTRFPFVKNGLALIAPNESKLSITNLQQLSGVKIEHFIIGDPDSVPAGRYGKQALEAAGVWDDLAGKVVYASDVRQVLTQVEAGNGDGGLVFLTDAKTGQNSQIILQIDHQLHNEIVYPAAMIAASANKEAARQFLDFLNSEEGKVIFSDYGFITD